MTTVKERRVMEHDIKIVSIYNKPLLIECYNRLQRRFNLEQDAKKKKAIQKRMNLFSKRIAYIEEVLSRRKIK
jgi:hypothetical protein